MNAFVLYPLKFIPLFKEKVWGGRKLASALGKSIPEGGKPIGESWELVDLPDHQSVVANGTLAGLTLRELVSRYHSLLMGPVALDEGRFPLLVKYIDASQTLSVQVHPDETVARSLGGRAKSEAWYILDAETDSKLVVGLEEGTTKQTFKEAIAQQRVEALLKETPALAGTLLPVRPGTIHAIGAGVMLAEVQQPSDTTYRVYDWGRLGLDGQPRELHLEQALMSTHFDQLAEKADEGSIVDMGRFKIRPLYLEQGHLVNLSGEGPAVVVNLSGKAQIITAGQDAINILEKGDVLLLPHCLRHASFSDSSDSSASIRMLASTRARILCVTFPVEVK